MVLTGRSKARPSSLEMLTGSMLVIKTNSSGTNGSYASNTNKTRSTPTTGVYTC